MAERTAIEWTATVHPDGTVTPGSSWNPLRAAGPDGEVTGWACVKVSPACAACYAERLNLLRGNGRPYLPGRHAPPVLDERALRHAGVLARPSADLRLQHDRPLLGGGARRLDRPRPRRGAAPPRGTPTSC